MNLKTGYENLDNVIGGLNGGELIVIASRPGMGKSTLALNIANLVAKQTNDKILYFTLETSKERLKEKITTDNVEIVDKPRITIEEIKKKCEEVSKSNLALVVIDYIQLIEYSIKSNYITNALKEITLELNVPIIVVSQLGRKQIEEREDKRPILSDLDSSITQDSDKVIFLYSEKYYNKEYELNDIELIVAKNCGGTTGTIKLL